MARPKIIFIVGRTASGKSAVAMEVAKKLDGEIIAADSQTLRRGLDIGTAKPTAQDRQAVVHHMIDVIEPYERFSVAAYKKQAEAIIADCLFRNKVPIVVGGSGLYIDALFYDFSIDTKKEYDDEYEAMSADELQLLILKKGYKLPENAQNPRHLVGVLRRQGFSPVDKKPIQGAIIVGLERSDSELKQRIRERVELMFEQGFVDEVEAVISTYGQPPVKLDAIGYPIVLQVLEKNISAEEAKKLFIRGDWQYARKQKAWFKRNKYIHWFNSSKEATEYILESYAK